MHDPVAVLGLSPLFTQRLGVLRLSVQNGMPAAKVHDNIVSVPLGQALAMIALGPVSVLGNQFTSRGMVLDLQSPSFWASDGIDRRPRHLPGPGLRAINL